MPKLRLLSLFFLLAYPALASADETLTITTYYPSPYGSYNTLYVYNNLGIGTTGPTDKLDVYGTPSQTLQNVVGIFNTNAAGSALNTGAAIIMGRASDSYYAKIATVFESQNPDYLRPALAFYTMDSTYLAGSETERMRIKANGNVGIGTTGPSARLEISKNDGGNGSAGLSDYGIVTTATGGQATLGAEYIGDGYANLDLGSNISGTRRFWHISKRLSTNANPHCIEIYFYNGTTFVGPLFTFTTGGNFTATGTKSFEIDHPTKPGYKLVHACLEGPEAAVFYRGKARLVNGHATVKLPEYFEALTRKEGCTIQLTCKDEQPFLLSASEVAGGKFEVYGTKPDGRFWWEVKAVRADVEPLKVEKLKEQSNKNKKTSQNYFTPLTNISPVASDIRVKKDIRPYTNGLSIIKRINPVWFKYNGKAGFPDNNQEHIGVIGQEIIKVAPYTVNTFREKLNPGDKEPAELLNFNSHALTFDLINSVKELDSKIASLAQENQELKKELTRLKTKIK